MFLQFSDQSDTCASRVYSALRDRGKNVLLVDDSLSSEELGVTWHPGGRHPDDCLRVASERVPLSEIEGVFLRHLNPIRPNDAFAEQDKHYALNELSATLTGLLVELPCPVINRPDPVRFGKPLYVRPHIIDTVRSTGFEVPVTFFGSTLTACESFLERHPAPGYAITPLSAGKQRSLADAQGVLDQLKSFYEDTPMFPVQIQLLEGRQPLRLYVVDSKTFPVWGTGSESGLFADAAPHEHEAPPAEIAENTVQLVRKLGLTFAEVGLLRDDSGTWRCHEVNEFPTFDYCPDAFQRRVADAVAGALIGDES